MGIKKDTRAQRAHHNFQLSTFLNNFQLSTFNPIFVV